MTSKPQNHNLDTLVTAEAVGFLFKSLPNIVVSMTLMPLVVMAAMWQRVDQRIVIAWGAASLLVLAWRYGLARTWQRQSPAAETAAHWGWRFTWTSVVSGLLWGFAGYAFFVHDSISHQLLIFACIIGLTVGQLMVTAYWLPSFYALTFTAMGGLILRLLTLQDWSSAGLALLLLMYVSIVSRVARNANANGLAAIRLRFENLDLVEELKEKKEAAEQANRAKTRFLASASHDLRQPVHALALFADTLGSEVSSDRGREILKDIDHSIDAINQLLGSLLDISKLDAGVVVPMRSAVAMPELFRDIEKEFAGVAQARGLELRIRDCKCVVESDPVLLTSIIRNFVSNAIRYTNRGALLLACRRRGDHLSIEVWDTGIGIPESEHKAIFAEFHQLDNPERDRNKGLGLGLAICQRLGALMGCRVSLASRPGRGSVFRLQVPLSSESPVASQPQDVAAVAPARLEGRTILVVDDEAAVREGMLRLLQGWGCQTLSAENVQQAVDQAVPCGAALSLIIADYRLRAQETGVDVIEAVQAALNRAVPAIIVTGDTAPERLREAESSGYLLMHKPVKPARLRMAISERLAKK